MNSFIFFIAIATIITIGIESLKKVQGELCRKIKILGYVADLNIGVFIAPAFAVWGIFSFGSGLLKTLGIENYPNPSFQNFDLLLTALVVSLGSAGVYEFIKAVGNRNTNETQK